MSPLGSLHKIRGAVVRDLWKEPGTILAPDERVPVESAIRAVTRNAAWQCHSEHEIGSLEPGKLADLVVLEDDPRAVEATAISDIRVSETWMDGRRVFGGCGAVAARARENEAGGARREGARRRRVGRPQGHASPFAARLIAQP